MSTTPTIDKGGSMEEVLRAYFLDSGYFVIRGAQYFYMDNVITDVDLWLYQRASSFSRQRINVDIKNKRIPQALERILWTKGLQIGLRLDGSIVATTDMRETVKRFGELQNVTVLDGKFLAKLKSRYAFSGQRIAEEELTGLIRINKSDRIGGDWLDRIALSKSRMLTQLDFDGCNSLINDARYFIDQVQTVAHRGEIACRLMYLVLSYILITIDFLTRESSFSDKELQNEKLNDGFRFGTSGKKGAEKVFSMADKIAAAYARQSNTQSSNLAKQLRSEAESLRVEILTEFVMKTGTNKSHFDLAKSFESLAFSREFLSPISLQPEGKSFIGTLLDMFELDRGRFFDAASVPISNIIQKSEEPSSGTAIQLEIPQALTESPVQAAQPPSPDRD